MTTDLLTRPEIDKNSNRVNPIRGIEQFHNLGRRCCELFLVISFWLLATALVLAQTPNTAPTSSGGALKVLTETTAPQPRTLRIGVRSPRINHDFQIDITWPVTPITPGEKLPVVYALDGGFDVAGTTTGILFRGRQIASAFVVSIGYPEGRNYRNSDLFHTGGSFVTDGPVYEAGGADFEKFFLNELRPYLENRFPFDPKKSILFGHSLGGTFATTVLARKPDAFAGYLIGSPTFKSDPQLIDRVKAITPRGDGIRIFVGYALEDIQLFQSDKLIAPLTTKESKFATRHQLFEGETHVSSYVMMLMKGLPFVLPAPPVVSASPRVEPKEVKIDPNFLDLYVGTYLLAPGIDLVVTREADRLFWTQQGARAQLIPQSDNQFFVRRNDISIQFNLGADGKAEAMELTQRGNTRKVPRTK